MQTSMTYSLPPAIEKDLHEEIENWDRSGTIGRIWKRDASVWTGGDEAKWLGWLDIAERELNDAEKYRELQADIADAGFEDIVLMGMGGSSLCPEVLSVTFGERHFHILDSTVPAQVRSVENSIDIGKTLFIVASKSGSTLEPSCFKQYFFDRVAATSDDPGKQFIAITDPGSKLDQEAKADGFRHVFYGDPQVGGRFSALSPFGMAAAAAMGLDVERLLTLGSEMAAECRIENTKDNPGALLGLILGICHRHGRDKLTIFTSPQIYDLGAWLEQLVAESTGKSGVAIIPVDGEPVEPAVSYGDDRVFVQLALGPSDEAYDLASLRAVGHPVVRIELNDLYYLGAEFFRWEFATAVAGAVMGIDPFNQPDVESAKVEARKITDRYEETGSLPEEEHFFESDGIKLFSSAEYATRLIGMVDEPGIGELLSAHVANVEDGDYFAVLGFIEMNAENHKALQAIRVHVLEKRLAATCLGFGPRFLHSTGQAYKGGANNGVFLQITADAADDLPVPGQKYTFGVVAAAQARGDMQVLLDRGRRALRVHLADIGQLQQIVSALTSIQ